MIRTDPECFFFHQSVWIMWNLKRWWIVNQSEYHVSGYLDLGSIPLFPATRAAWCQGKLDIFMVCHMDGLYCSLCVLWSFYIPVIQRWSSCYSTYEMKKCFYLLTQFGHHFWLKCIIWTIVLTCRKFVVFFFIFFFHFGKYSSFQIIAITWFINIDRTRAGVYLACWQLLIISSLAEAFLHKHEA